MRLLLSLDPMDIVSGATRIDALSSIIHQGVRIRVLPKRPRLHAKVYVFDRNTAVVTSANLTNSAFDRNFEVGVEVDGPEAQVLAQWFDGLWEEADALGAGRLEELDRLCRDLRQKHLRFVKKARKKVTAATAAWSAGKAADRCEPLHTAGRFFVCNTDRKQGDRTEDGSYLLEKEMHDRGYACAWETFKFPGHMKRVQEGDAIFMYAKSVGIIAVGMASAGCETLGPRAANRIRSIPDEDNSTEWRIPVRWLVWCKDSSAHRYMAPNFTFWDVSGKPYTALRSDLLKHFSNSE